METALQLQMQLLKYYLELEESNYKYAVELQKDQNTLWRMRETIQKLKEELNILYEKIQLENTHMGA